MVKPIYIRTCQECFHEQVSRDPNTYPPDNENWRDLKCRKCRSMALDFGKWIYPDGMEVG